MLSVLLFLSSIACLLCSDVGWTPTSRCWLFQAFDDAKEEKSSEPTLESLPQTQKDLLCHRHFLFKTEKGQRTVSKHRLGEIADFGVLSSEIIRPHVTHADAADRYELVHTSGV
jgi:hypothetical protein